MFVVKYFAVRNIYCKNIYISGFSYIFYPQYKIHYVSPLVIII